jgi:hypothetical protein
VSGRRILRRAEWPIKRDSAQGAGGDAMRCCAKAQGGGERTHGGSFETEATPALLARFIDAAGPESRMLQRKVRAGRAGVGDGSPLFLASTAGADRNGSAGGDEGTAASARWVAGTARSEAPPATG